MVFEENLREIKPGMTAFPQDIFVPEQPWLADHLLPLLSIDLGMLRPELAGTVVHMLCPIEPFEAYIGDDTQAFHNEFTAPNWFALQLTEDNRYRFLGNEGYFQRAPVHGGAFLRDPHAPVHTAEMLESFAKARAHFEAHGKLASYSRYGNGESMVQAYLDNLGGEFSCGNWAGNPPIPAAFEFSDSTPTYEQGGLTYRHGGDKLPNDGIAITRDGQPFFPVADVAGYNWCAAGADAILLFYEPVSRTVLFTFDWS